VNEKVWLPTGAWFPTSTDDAPDDVLGGLSDEARRGLLDGVRANIKRLKASRLAPPLEAAEAIRAFEEMARRIEASFPSPPHRRSRLRYVITWLRNG
jgi:hypothetical protein